MKALTSRWFISFIGVAVMAALVWFYAPLVPQLEGGLIRLVIILMLLLVWGCANLLLDLRRERRDAALAKGITVTGDSEATEEAEALRSKLTQALALLKKALGGRGYLYEQPWYAIIGPPGAGKTTALLNSGLRFPLAERMGQGAIAGVGGTRLCDWWFTDEAVLIDTAGRYTTHDSNAAVDRAGWDAFLDLLKQTRPNQPLNGLLVAFPLSDIALAPAAERLAHAAAIRQRIKEMEARLGLRMPVYVLFTKADLIAGFIEFFDDLDREQRAQVWGTTFAATKADAGPVAGFTEAFRALVERLNGRLFERMQGERDPQRNARIATFPGQVASLEQPLTEFMQAAFGGSRADPAPMLRGVYITSGTQEGTPIDRLVGTLSRLIGVDRAKAATAPAGQGRSYFLERLLKDVIFTEATLVAHHPAAERSRAVARAAGFALAGVLVAVMVGLLWHARSTGEREIDATRTALAGYEQVAHGLTLDPVADDDLVRLAPLLDAARALPHGAGTREAPLMLGLSQDAKLATAARDVYRHALEWALLPRLIWRLEGQLRGNMNRPDFLYEATRIYLMLGGAGPLDASLVHEWMKLDWQAAYPGDAYAPLRASLLRDLDALLAEPLPPVQLDGELVAQARSRFAAVPMAQRVYSRIRSSAAARQIPEWRPSEVLGPAGVPLFVRASGKPLSDGIPGFFTVEGFDTVLLPSVSAAAKDVLSESWVLGSRIAFDANGSQMDTLKRDVIALYETDYALAWDQMLADLNIAPPRSLSRAAQDLYILASPQSPMRNLLASASRQLMLSVPITGAPQPAPAAPAAPASGDSAELRLRALLGAPQPEAPAAPLPPGHEIDERYRALQELVGTGPGAPIDSALRAIGEMQQQLAKMAATLVSSGTAAQAATGGYDPVLGLREEAAREPQPLSRWLTEIAASASALRSGNPRQQLAAIFNAAGGPAEVCPSVVNNHYPFVAGASEDVPIAQFARLFAPGGLLDGFLNTLLRPYIDMSGGTWRLLPADAGAGAPVSPADLAQFQRAALIRDVFFADKGTTPSIQFDIEPVSADEGTAKVSLELGGTAIVYAHDTPRSTQMTWPSPESQQTARLVFDPRSPGQESVLQEAGPWSMFRLFSHARIQPQAGSPGRYSITFQSGERRAVFNIRVQLPADPFAPATLQDFRCPSVRAG